MSATEPVRDPKVSVIVPVYNPGSHIDDCISSFLGQTLPPGEIEAIFVDDGSSDGTEDRLDRLAAEHPHITTIHIPNSGWPGKPRNIGIDTARGEYLYFVDNDDWLEPDALQRLYETATREDADIVIGKIIGHRRGIARELFRHNRSGMTLEKEPMKLLSMLTPHKLFRASLIRDHGLRYPEGRRRLEDHVFVLQAYFAADAVSVLSDYPVYHWVRREDETNASSVPPDRGYWENLVEVLDIVEEQTEPGPYRDRLFAHWLKGKVLRRVDAQHLEAYSPEFRAQLLADIREIVMPRFSLAVGRRMDGILGIRDRLVRANRLDGLEALGASELGIGAHAQVTGARWEDGVLVFDVEGTWTNADGTPFVFGREEDGRLSWPLPAETRAIPELSPPDWDVTDRIPKGNLRAFIRERESRVEYLLETTSAVHARAVEGGATLAVKATVRFDPQAVAAGKPLRNGVWDLSFFIGCFGLHVADRLKAGREGTNSGPSDLLAPVGVDGPSLRPVIAYATVGGNVAVDLGGSSRKLGEMAPPAKERSSATRDGEAIAVDLSMDVVVSSPDAVPASLVLRRTGTTGTEPTVVPATIERAADGAHVRARIPVAEQETADAIAPGRWRVTLELGERRTKLGIALDAPRRGAPRLLRISGEPAASSPAVRAKRALMRVPPVRAAVEAIRGPR